MSRVVYTGPYAGVSEYDLFILNQSKAAKEKKIAAFGYETMIKAAQLGFDSIEEYVKFMKECHIQMFGPSILAMPEKSSSKEQHTSS
jgi:hypothetical protein